MFNLLHIKKSLSDVTTHKESLENSITSKRTEIDNLRNSPPPQADIVSSLCGDGGVVDRHAANFDAALNFTVARLSRHPLNPERVNGIGIFTATPPNMAPSVQTLEVVLLALFRDEVKESLRKRIEAMPWPKDAGPRIADRPALIEKAERELSKLENELSNLRKQAAEAGVLI